MTNPCDEQLKEALDAEEEHHSIVFLCKVDKHKYNKLIKEMENDILQKKNPSKSVSDMCLILAGWKNRYSSKYNHFSEMSDVIALPQQEDLQRKERARKKR